MSSRLVNRIGTDEKIQRATLTKGEYMAVCYHPRIKCTQREISPSGEKFCPYTTCVIRKN